MTSTDLVPREALPDYATLERLAGACAKSGYFKDATDAAKAYVKVVAGAELGIGPVQAMTGIHIVQGKPTLSASLVGALIKRSGRYDYRVVTLTDSECVLDFYEHGQRVGDSRFTLEDARKAGLTGNPTWQKFARNMLLSRALTNGARWYCPDVFGGAVYTPDELGAVVDGDGEFVALPEKTGPADSAQPGECSSVSGVAQPSGASIPCPSCGHPLKRKREGKYFCAARDGGCGKEFEPDKLEPEVDARGGSPAPATAATPNGGEGTSGSGTTDGDALTAEQRTQLNELAKQCDFTAEQATLFARTVLGRDELGPLTVGDAKQLIQGMLDHAAEEKAA